MPLALAHQQSPKQFPGPVWGLALQTLFLARVLHAASLLGRLRSHKQEVSMPAAPSAGNALAVFNLPVKT